MSRQKEGLLVLGLLLFWVAAVPAQAALVAYYQFENNANDSVGTFNGTAVGAPTYVPGVWGQAISFDGATQYVSLPNLAGAKIVTTDLTIAYWLKTADAGGTTGTQFWNGEGLISAEVNTARRDFGSSVINGQLVWGAGWRQDGTNRVDYSIMSGAGNLINTNQWIHVAMTRKMGVAGDQNNKGVLEIYLNGVQVATGSPANWWGYPVDEPLRVFLGVMSQGVFNEAPTPLPASYFTCLMDDLRFYDTVLTTSQIQAAMTQGEAELVAPALGAPVAGPSVNLQWQRGGGFTGTVSKYYVYLDTESADLTDPNRDKLPPAGPAMLVRKQQVNPVGGTESWTWAGPANDDTNYYWLVDTVALVPKSPTDPNTVEMTLAGGGWDFRGSRTTAVLTGPTDQYVLPSLDRHQYAADPNVTFTVSIETDPEYQNVYDVVWYHDGAVVSNDSRHTITTTNTQTSLKIEPVDLTANALADNGRYYCQVRLNIGGSPGGMVESSRAWLVATQILRHRYSFTQDGGNTFKVTDSVWGKHGTITEPNHWGRWSWGAGELALNVGQAARNSNEPNEINWVDLPNNMISALGNHATFLAWYTWQDAAATTDAQAFCYGTPGSGIENATGPNGASGNNVSLSPKQGAGAGNIQFSTRNTTGTTNVTGGAPAAAGTQECVAVVWNGTANQITVYKNGVAGNTGAPNQKLSDLLDLNNWLGRGQRNQAQTFVGKYNELRIYDIPLTAPWVKALSDAGPEVLAVNPCLNPPGASYDDNGDCVVNLKDFATWTADWLHCGLLSCN